MKLLIIATVLSIAYAQFHDLPLTTPKPWKGPIADHMLGIHPADTPEVAAAKVQHLTAYREVLSVLPELPIKDRFINNSPLPSVPSLQQESHPQWNQVQHIIQHLPTPSQASHFHASNILIGHVQNPVAVPTRPRVLAEDIPRSTLGEVPEVAAAREAHLKAYEEARRLLPQIPLE